MSPKANFTQLHYNSLKDKALHFHLKSISVPKMLTVALRHASANMLPFLILVHWQFANVTFVLLLFGNV